MKNARILTLVLLFLGFTSISYGQFPGCPSVDAGEDQAMTCEENCVTLTATPFLTGSTDSYTVQSIPFAPPISFTEPGGTSVSVGTDDVWSPQINLPFDFCFYGQTYNTCKIGSNGSIGLGTISATGHPWSFSAEVPSTALNSAGHIHGLYHDMYPPSGGTVKWYLLGQAPCRTLVVVFNELPHFSCTSLRTTFMMVLYETTNVIDVYVQKKELCSSWNGGRAIIGIQNQGGTQGIAAPGRNSTQWTTPASSPEAWRFSPAGAPQYTLEWLDENGTVIATTNSIEVCPSSPTTYTARATYIPCNNGTPIIVEDQVNVISDPDAPQVSAPADIDICIGESVTISAINPNNSPISWNNGLQNGVAFTPTAVGSTTYTVTSTVGDCTTEDDVTVTVHALPIVGAGASQTICVGDNVTVSGSGAETYAWNNNVTNNLPFAPTQTATYTVTGTDEWGCVNTSQVTINVLPLPSATINGDNIVCVGDNDPEVQLVGTQGTAPYTFTYSINGGASQTVTSGPNGIANVPVPTLSAGVFSYNLSMISDSGPLGCINTNDESVQVTVHPTPSGLISGGISLCRYSDSPELTFTGLQGTGDYQFTYTVSGSSPNYISSSNSNTATLEASTSSAGNFTYNLIKVKDLNTGCEGLVNESQLVTIYPLPVASFNPHPGGISSYEYESTMINTSTGANSYYWTFGDGGSSSQTEPTHEFNLTQGSTTFTVTLTAYSPEGCVDTTFGYVEYIEDIIYYIPNTFTPDNDDYNESFKPIFTSGFDPMFYTLTIYNRWGETLFESHNHEVGWDGTYGVNSNQIVKEGSYIWKIEFKETMSDKHHVIRGHVNVLK